MVDHLVEELVNRVGENSDTFQRLLNIQKEGWLMLGATFNRVQELAGRK